GYGTGKFSNILQKFVIPTPSTVCCFLLSCCMHKVGMNEELPLCTGYGKAYPIKWTVEHYEQSPKVPRGSTVVMILPKEKSAERAITP
ncbi:hypothetical protein WH47_05404, partial [Habropoda laboriosa]